MNLEIRRVHLLYAVGVFLGIISVFYFAFILLKDLSPTITATILFLAFLLFGTTGMFIKVERHDLVFILSRLPLILSGSGIRFRGSSLVMVPFLLPWPSPRRCSSV